MKAVFIGAVQASAELLPAAVDAGLDIASVLTLPPDQGRQRHADYADLAPVCCQLDLPLTLIANDSETEAAVRERAPDLLLVWGWSRLISREVLSLAKYGGIGFHPSPLPLGRGRHPLIWSILLGLPQGAVTFFALSEDADTGDVLVQRQFPISRSEDANGLMRRAIREACAAMPGLVAHIQKHGTRGSPQDESKVVVWRKRSAADGKIDFRMSGGMIDRLVRALTRPYPGADAMHHDLGSAKVWRVSHGPRDGAHAFVEPGRVVARLNGAPVVACADGVVALQEHEFPRDPEIGSWFC